MPVQQGTLFDLTNDQPSSARSQIVQALWADWARVNSHRPYLLPFPWFGGKSIHLKWLLPLLPPCHHYCEPFGGSAAVLLNRPPSPIETYNDLNGDIVCFFRILRDRTDELIEALALTPHSRSEFVSACNRNISKLSDLERARRFFVRTVQGYSAVSLTAGSWAYSRGESRTNMSKATATARATILRLKAVADRLLRVQIENRPALDIIQRYDTPSTLFYCDPPYLRAVRPGGKGYDCEMTDQDHRDLAAALHRIQGRAAVSGYDCELYNELYAGWRKAVGPLKPLPAGRCRRKQREALWMNY